VTTSRLGSRCLLFAISLALFASGLSAQSLGSLLTGKSSATTTNPQPDDPLKRGTPRSAIRNFLEACHNERYVQASLYLDLQNLPSRQRTTDGPELAKQLADILDRDSHFELSLLSDAPTGSDAQTPNRELLVSVPVNGTRVDLYLQREAKQNGEIWLVSQDSVAKLPRFDDLDQESVLEKKLPEVMVSTKLLGTSVWIWFALVLAAVILSLVSRLLSRLVIVIMRPVAMRYAASFHAHRLEAFTEPLRLLLSIVVFRAVIEFFDPSALLRDYLLKILTLLFAFGAASLIMRIIDVVFDQIQSRLNSRERALTYSVLPLSVRVLKILVFCIFVLFTLSAWGYNTNAILAGVGVGGLAVALAAQKTIENFFGGVSVITDRPVLVGDFCQFGGQVGTVEDIGLRSTRIRTLDRTLVTIPNSQFSTMTLENYSRRDRMWFHPTIRLRRGTTAEKVTEFMEKITGILKSDPMISVGAVPLRFTKIDEQSLNIEIFAYVLSDSFDTFLEMQTKLLLQFLKGAEETGISLAMPIVESINSTANSSGAVSSTMAG
jgi:MscS family membrane protein